MKVVFMRTSEFAVASLDAIVQAGHEVAAVVTVPDKPAGRGQQLRFSDVKNYALEHQLPVLQPEKLKEPSFVDALRQLAADVFVVVAFRMLPEIVYSMPPKGTFNIHASLLPQYRGAAPINWAVINGEVQTRNLGIGVNPRTALGQREDGALLLLVLDGRSVNTLGATMEDIVNIMLDYGAVNAGNLVITLE